MASSCSTAGMKGMREAVTCGVCLEVYKAGLREPVALPCGHTFCRSCLLAVAKSHHDYGYYDNNDDDDDDYGLPLVDSIRCPSCRKYHRGVELSVNVSLLRLTSSYTDFKDESCSEHGDDLRYWCCGCEVQLCNLCLNSGHHLGHKVHLAKAYMQEKRDVLEASIKLLVETQLKQCDSKTENQRNKVKQSFVKLVQELSELCESSSTLHDTRLNLLQLLDKVKKMSSITELKEAEAKLEEFQCEERDRGHAEAASGDYESASKVTQEDIHADATQNIQQTTNVVRGAELEAASEASNVQQEGKGWCARVDYKDGRLLLHCLDCPDDTLLSFSYEEPSEVFFAVSAGGSHLGQVNIRLWCHVHQARQFLALCLGALGPSYRGAKASKVLNSGDQGECLVVGGKRKKEQVFATHAEIGSTYEKPLTRGLVFVYDERVDRGQSIGCLGYGRVSEMLESCFVICTRGDPGKSTRCPFGEVVSGLEVVSAAVSHKPVTEVTVTHCGLVLPDILAHIVKE